MGAQDEDDPHKTQILEYKKMKSFTVIRCIVYIMSRVCLQRTLYEFVT